MIRSLTRAQYRMIRIQKRVPGYTQTDYDMQNFHFRKIISYPHSASTILALIFKVQIEVLRHFQKRLYESSDVIATVLLPFCYSEQRT
jgi:hypothetical protein